MQTKPNKSITNLSAHCIHTISQNSKRAVHLLSKSEQLGVLISVSLGLGNTSALQGLDASRALKDERRDETLDLRRLSLGLLLALSKLDWPIEEQNKGGLINEARGGLIDEARGGLGR